MRHELCPILLPKYYHRGRAVAAGAEERKEAKYTSIGSCTTSPHIH